MIAEKPDAAAKIAFALGGMERRHSNSAVIEVSKGFDGNSYIVCSAIGHLFEVSDPGTDRSVFPSFDIDWFPKSTRSRKLSITLERRIEAITKASSKASRFVNACDYDIEGETIGMNILQFACNNPSKIFRAKFSTLVAEDVREAFLSLKLQDRILPLAGRLRHELDFIWGANLSRLLTKSANISGGGFTNVTIGRVQGPTLEFVVQREVENKTHIPIPTWVVSCNLRKNLSTVKAFYSNSPVRTLSEAETLFSLASQTKQASVKSVETDKLRVHPRYPFDLGELQKEAFRAFHMTPSLTLRIAESLYLKALISYPRTDSQKFPQRISPERILEKLAGNSDYHSLVKSLVSDVSRRKYSWEGPRGDPAHPAIHPTGEIPKANLTRAERQLYDMIVRRFLNCFSPDAVVTKTRTKFDLSSYEFKSEWDNVDDWGWMKYYPFAKAATNPLETELRIGELLNVEGVEKKEIYSKPRPRFNESSLLSKMESERLGTKSTRAGIISTLLSRGYIRKSKFIQPQGMAMRLIFGLRAYCPEIVSSEMTRQLESELTLLQESKDTAESILINQLLTIRSSLRKLREMDNFYLKSVPSNGRSEMLGNCPICGKGELIAFRSFKTRKRFIRCSTSGCKTSSPLPSRGMIKKTKEICRMCGWPRISIKYRGRLAKKQCANYFCKSKDAIDVEE